MFDLAGVLDEGGDDAGYRAQFRSDIVGDGSVLLVVGAGFITDAG